MDVRVPRCWNGSPELVNALLVDPRRGRRTTLGASQAAAGFELTVPPERSSKGCSRQDVLDDFEKSKACRYPHDVFLDFLRKITKCWKIRTQPPESEVELQPNVLPLLLDQFIFRACYKDEASRKDSQSRQLIGRIVQAFCPILPKLKHFVFAFTIIYAKGGTNQQLLCLLNTFDDINPTQALKIPLSPNIPMFKLQRLSHPLARRGREVQNATIIRAVGAGTHGLRAHDGSSLIPHRNTPGGHSSEQIHGQEPETELWGEEKHLG
ncbi:jg10503 [Pararge aegeria aegeria]|uniref:Jg10503 protein n=1 Tax=Pararge aegeria aegeria TaxID=348720 RepID=A0A8S4RIU4_9NEOP|nr:jg10503 [Pararge aegeria aegeria]